MAKKFADNQMKREPAGKVDIDGCAGQLVPAVVSLSWA
jgi:hypothetical protein